MKILILIAASMFGFGLAVKDTCRVPQPKEATVAYEAPANLDEPVMDVLLDTVEISVIAPAAVALN
ncbi:hypothetical protein [Pontibacter rugosus]|uniref:Uncharacterized protein n=1 Tax=Pontibacter rugosus TaxID=1745966 RepID=A0ABW3SVQ1_9BACT